MPFGREKHSHGYEGGPGSNRRRAAERAAERNPPKTSRRQAQRQAEEATVVTISPTGEVSAPVHGSSPAATKAAQKAAARAKASRSRARRAKRAASREERRKRAIALSSVAASRRRRARERDNDKPASVARISSRSEKSAKPAEYHGRKTAGTPTKSELDEARKSGTLKVNKKGYVTTPDVRQVSRQLRKAQKAVRKSMPDTSGLSPEERRILPFARRAHREYPDIPVSVLMAQDKQESGFNPNAESSAGAFGTSQFIPSTAATYGVKRGSSPKAIQSQLSGQAHLLHDQNFATDPQGALSAYSGGYAASDYNNPILADAKANYRGLDRKGSPKARKRLAKAKKNAKSLGLHPKALAGPHVGPPPKKLVKRTVVAEHAMREVEGTPYVRGGGHGSFTAAGGLDCSGAVSYVLHKVAPKRVKSPLTSGAMGSVLEPGPGALTVFYNPEHTFLRLINRKGEAEYWGTSVGDSGAGGLTRHPTPSKSYLAQYSVGHVPGMGKKQALQLGADPAAIGGGTEGASSFSYGGMEFTDGGSTATIAPGAAATKKGKPGRSKRPIRLTTRQRYNRAKRKLAAVGAPLRNSSKSGRSESHPILEELKAKYGSAATSTTAKA